MTQYDNTNRGLLSRNDKQGNESRPDYRGSINVDGRDYWISGWLREGREGTKLAGQRYMSLSVQPKDASYPAAAPAPAPVAAPAPRAVIHDRAPVPPVPRAAVKTGTAFDDMDSDIPF